MSCTVEQREFLENLRLHLIDLSRRLEQDSGDDFKVLTGLARLLLFPRVSLYLT